MRQPRQYLAYIITVISNEALNYKPNVGLFLSYSSNVIDVAALRPNCMEPNEYLEKKNFYKTRLSSFLNSPWPAPGTPRKYILRDIPDPERVLSSEPVSKNNYIMVKLIILGIFKNPIIRTRESQYSKVLILNTLD